MLHVFLAHSRRYCQCTTAPDNRPTTGIVSRSTPIFCAARAKRPGIEGIYVHRNICKYSKVFISNKGTGNKYIQDFHDTFDNYDIELLTLKKHFGFDNITPANFLEKVFEMKSKAFELLQTKFEKKCFFNANEISLFWKKKKNATKDIR